MDMSNSHPDSAMLVFLSGSQCAVACSMDCQGYQWYTRYVKGLCHY